MSTTTLDNGATRAGPGAVGAGAGDGSAGARSTLSPAAVVGRYLDALNGGDADLAAEMVSEEFVSEHPSDPIPDLVGRAAHRECLRTFLSELRGVSYEPEDVIGTGGRVALPYRMTGSWQAPDGIGHLFSLRGVFVFTVCDGEITRRADYWDGMDFARQVGID